MSIIEFISTQQSKGHYSFSLENAQNVLKEKSHIALSRSLFRLKRKGMITEPVRGFYVIITPEYKHLKCLPAEHFIDQMMKYLGSPYYVGLLTAAMLHGASHQAPQVFQVITPNPHKTIKCGKVAIQFIEKKCTTDTPTKIINTPTGYMTISTPEATAKDLVIYPHHSGGLNNVLTVLVELGESINPKELIVLLDKSNDAVWAQRLGFLLECVEYNDIADALLQKLAERRFQKRLLAQRSRIKEGPFDEKWKLIINERPESDIEREPT